VAATGPTTVHPEVAGVLHAALEVGRASGGAFDITVEPLVRAWGFLGGTPHVPDSATVRRAFAHVGARHVRFDPATRALAFDREGVRIDLGGIAKGCGVDAARRALEAQGIRDALVDLSGNMFALGRPAGAPAWRIGIRDPRDRAPYFARLALTGRAIATSGKYEQFVAASGRTYGHILDPRTGVPAEGLISVTVLAPDAMTADAWGTALFVLGPAAARRAALARDDLDAVLVAPGASVDTVFVERSLRQHFSLESNARARFHVVYF
jgi:thiamine biosynthesis lipoprotein